MNWCEHSMGFLLYSVQTIIHLLYAKVKIKWMKFSSLLILWSYLFPYCLLQKPVRLSLFSFLCLIQNFTIIFINISLFLFHITEECVSDVECQMKYPGPHQHLLRCTQGNCVMLVGQGKNYFSIMSKTFIFFTCYSFFTLINCLKVSHTSPT